MTPAATHTALRFALAQVLADTAYTDDLISEALIRRRLEEAAWTDEQTQALKAVTLRWARAQNVTAWLALRKALGEELTDDEHATLRSPARLPSTRYHSTPTVRRASSSIAQERTTPMTRTLPHKMTELGRLRLGDREPNSNGRGTHPHKLSAFRLTSANRSLLGFAANLYGGTVQEWTTDGAPKDEHGRPTQYELYTEANSLDVLIPTMSAVTLSYELWSAAGCQRRCDGEFIRTCPLQPALEGSGCVCPEDDLARAEQAKSGKACARILRLNVLLPDLPGLGTWRLETKGFYASAELLGTLDMLKGAGAEHAIIEAVLRLEQRTIKRFVDQKAQTMKFAVPVLWPKWTPRQLLAGAANVLLVPPAPSVLPALSQHIADLYGAATAAEDPLVARITTLLEDQGLDPEAIATWWAKMDAKYAGRTPMTLSLLYEQLVERVQAKAGGPTPTREPGDEDPNQTDLWTQEEAEE